MSEVQNQAETVAKPKLTRAEKLAVRVELLTKRISEDQAELASVQAEIEQTAALAAVDAGNAVVIKLGRAETTREVPARVIAVSIEEDGGKLFKVQYGSGFDTEVAVVRAGQIVSVIAE